MRAAANSVSFGSLRLTRVLGDFNADFALVQLRHAMFTAEVPAATTAHHERHSDSILFLAPRAMFRASSFRHRDVLQHVSHMRPYDNPRDSFLAAQPYYFTAGSFMQIVRVPLYLLSLHSPTDDRGLLIVQVTKTLQVIAHHATDVRAAKCYPSHGRCVRLIAWGHQP
jgi:hypothetical protein